MLRLDASSLASVGEATEDSGTSLDNGMVDPLKALLCCNAGGRHNGRTTYSPDGCEKTFATSCLGNFLVVALFIGGMAEGAASCGLPAERMIPM